jgi:hypothetical protein
MSTPLSPEQAQAAAQAQLAEQAQTVTGTPSAGVYGDPAGAAQPSSAGFDLSKATAAAADVEKLLADLQALQVKAQAAVDAANPPPPPPDDTLHVENNAPSWMADLVRKIEKRLAALEGKSAG